MVDAEPNGAAENKKRRVFHYVLVAVPGWPEQDPGRRMIYWQRPTEAKAHRMVKRLRRQMPEFEWTTEALTEAQARDLARAPFSVQVGDLLRVQVRWTGRVWKVEKPATGS